jgi:hypothetical protein
MHVTRRQSPLLLQLPLHFVLLFLDPRFPRWVFRGASFRASNMVA